MRPHVLTPYYAETGYPRRILVFDTETTLVPDTEGDRHVFRLGWAIYESANGKRYYHKLTTPGDIRRLILAYRRDNSPLWVIAHNIFYDMVVCSMFPWLEKLISASHWNLTKLIVDDGIFALTIKLGKTKINFFDTYNISRAPLEKIGRWIGKDKGKVNFDNVGESELSQYCQNDVEITIDFFDWWRKLLLENELGPFQISLAGQAFGAFRRRFMSEDIYIHKLPEVSELERSGYYGGRVEIFYKGKLPEENYYMVDINSSYPASMIFNVFPIKHKSFWPRGVSIAKLRELINEGYLVMAEVELNADKPYYPLRYGGHLTFPTGTFSTSLSTPEIELALDKGHLKKVAAVATYEKAVIFGDYVKFFHAKKNASTGVEREIYKLLLNSLYGKFGQKSASWVDIECPESEIIKVTSDSCVWRHITENDEIVTRRYILGLFQEKIVKDESYHSFPAIAAHVTAYARMLLLYYLEIAGWKNTFYCDTDSLIVNESGYLSLQSAGALGNQLGMLALEASSCNVRILAPKWYTFGNKIRHKGVSAKAIKLPSDDPTEVYEQLRWPKIASMLRDGNLDTYRTKKIVKRIRFEYTKGQVNSDGSVVPLFFMKGGQVGEKKER